MVVSWATPTCIPTQLRLCRPVVATALTCSCSTNFSKFYGSRRGIFIFYIAEKQPKVRTFVAEPNQVSLLQTHLGTWEDPDDGNDSEYGEEDEEVEANDLDFESDWEEEKNTPTTASVENSSGNKYEDDLVKEIEHLLGPEERATLQQSATPNLGKISTEKWSPLHTLALSGQISFMDNLLEQGVDINFVDKDGLTALHTAVIGKKEAVISHLLRKGANPNIKDKDGATPLHYAVQVGAMQTVKLLIKYEVDVNEADNEGWTPLHVALQCRHRFIAKLLLVSGADRTRRNKDGKTPLDLSFCYGKHFKSYELAKLLKVVPARDL
ncbi:hypothetical protein FNV43_RR26527 [Rhamnella rubrinervis]|uniref:Ankyrin repeat domain-containing protein EMB506, chloroplastic n=1 Tax=Rhamnella rubrinervis TaxID=2594499 RepID=A0A8K0DN58_9ROSA|nr:hypothetical protein FNV43_RR26527 [Rhamnella rubrinervis]